MGITVRVRNTSNFHMIFQISPDPRHRPLNIKVIPSISKYYPAVFTRFLYVLMKFFNEILIIFGFEQRVEQEIVQTFKKNIGLLGQNTSHLGEK